MTLRTALQDAIRPSTTRSTLVLWAKSLLNAVLFFGIFMVVLPWLAHRLLPMQLPFSSGVPSGVPSGVRTWLAGSLAFVGIIAWIACLDTFSRQGRGTPLPADSPRLLVTTGLFSRMRNPIMAAELCVIWAEALYLAGLGVTLYAISITVTAHWMVVHIEEPELHRRFGQSYAEYCRNVPRWLPGLRRRT